MFISGNFSDFKVKCRDVEWHLHRIVLAYRSKWFRNIIFEVDDDRGRMEVDLSDEESGVVEIWLEYLYLGNLRQGADTLYSTRRLVEVVELALKYQQEDMAAGGRDMLITKQQEWKRTVDYARYPRLH